VGFAGVRVELARVSLGGELLDLARWDGRTAFAAFVFTIGSTSSSTYQTSCPRPGALGTNVLLRDHSSWHFRHLIDRS